MTCNHTTQKDILLYYASLAQLVRATPLQGEGRRFDPVTRYQILLSVSKHGVGASLLTKNELGSIPRRTASFRILTANQISTANGEVVGSSPTLRFGVIRSIGRSLEKVSCCFYTPVVKLNIIRVCETCVRGLSPCGRASYGSVSEWFKVAA